METTSFKRNSEPVLLLFCRLIFRSEMEEEHPTIEIAADEIAQYLSHIDHED